MKKILFLLSVFCFTATNGQNALIVTTGASLYATNGALVTLEDINLNIAGSFNTGSYNDHSSYLSSTFRFSGNTTTNISASASIATPHFSRIEIAKTGGIVRLLCPNIQVFDAVSLISGSLDLNNNFLILMNEGWNGNPVSVFGESETNRIFGGLIRVGSWTLLPNTPINPGNLGIEITSLSPDCRGVFIIRGHTPQAGIPGIGASISRYYDLYVSGSHYCGNINPFNATVRFKYLDAELNGLNENSLTMWKSLDTGTIDQVRLNTDWTNLNYSSRDVTNNVIVQSAFIQSNPDIFVPGWSSRFTLSSGNSPRPITPAPQQIKTIAVPGRETITNKWKTWPNPADKILSIDITSTSASLATTSIFDSKGSLIRTQTDHLIKGSNRLKMDLKNLAAGIYYVTTNWDAGKEKRSSTFVKL